MMSIILSSMIAVMLCFGFIIIRHFCNVCKIMKIYTDIYDIQLHFQTFMADCSWPTGRRLDTPNPGDHKSEGAEELLSLFPVLPLSLHAMLSGSYTSILLLLKSMREPCMFYSKRESKIIQCPYIIIFNKLLIIQT